MDVIEFKNVSFSYEEDGNNVINDLTLTVKKGEYLCILGKNGSGKSTLARLMNGLLTDYTGEIKVFGYDTKDKSNIYEVRKRVGLVFQNPDNQMVATMVEDDIAFGPENLGIPPEEIGERIDFALKATNMEKYRNVAGQKLSGGQKQRVAIAGVLALKPEVLILDESTSMLDGKGRREVLNVVKKLNGQGVTVITITHYMTEAVDSDRVLVVDGGKVVKEGTPREIFKSGEDLKKYGLELPRETYIAEQLKLSGLPIKEGVLTIDELKEELCRLLRKN